MRTYPVSGTCGTEKTLCNDDASCCPGVSVIDCVDPAWLPFAENNSAFSVIVWSDVLTTLASVWKPFPSATNGMNNPPCSAGGWTAIRLLAPNDSNAITASENA